MDRKLLINAYRRLIRLSRFYGPLSLQLSGLIKTRIRQDYSVKYFKLTGDQFQHHDDIYRRLDNTVNFLNNSLVGEGGMEMKIIKSIIQYESSKAINGKLRSHFDKTTELKNIKRFREIRAIERASFMNGNASPEFLNNGKYDDQFSFGYIDVLKRLLENNEAQINQFHSGIVDFENVLIAFNEENELLL